MSQAGCITNARYLYRFVLNISPRRFWIYLILSWVYKSDRLRLAEHVTEGWYMERYVVISCIRVSHVMDHRTTFMFCSNCDFMCIYFRRTYLMFHLRPWKTRNIRFLCVALWHLNIYEEPHPDHFIQFRSDHAEICFIWWSSISSLLFFQTFANPINLEIKAVHFTRIVYFQVNDLRAYIKRKRFFTCSQPLHKKFTTISGYNTPLPAFLWIRPPSV